MEKELLVEMREIMKNELDPLKNMMDEIYEVVKSLEYSSKVNKVEYEKSQATIKFLSKLLEAERVINKDEDWITEEQIR